MIIVSLFFTPIMLNILGQSEYGLYTTAISLISLLSVLSIGFNSSYIKKYAEYLRLEDEVAIASLNGVFLILFSLIGLLCFSLGLLLVFKAKWLFADGLNESEYDKLQILLGLLTLNLAVGFPLSIFNSILGAHEQFVFQRLNHMIKLVGSPLIMLPVLLMGYTSVGMVVVTLICSFMADGIAMYYCFHRLNVQFRFTGWEKGLYGYLLRYSWYIVVGIIVDQVNWNLDRLILGRYRGAIEVAVYAVGATIFSTILQIGNNITQVFIPKIHSLVQTNSNDKVRMSIALSSLLNKVGRIQYEVIMLIGLGFVFYGQYFIRLWAGEDYKVSYYVCLILFFSSVVTIIQSAGIEMQRALFLHRFRAYVYSCVALFNLLLSIILCRHYGAIGCALGTCIAIILSDGLIMNYYYANKMQLNITDFWREIIKISIGFCPPILFGVGCRFLSPNPTIIGYLFQLCLFTCIYGLSVYLLSMNIGEKEVVRKGLNIVQRMLREYVNAVK